MTMSTKKVIEVGKSKNILFHSKLILFTFWWKGKFFDSTSAELSSLRSIWYSCYILCFMTCNTSKFVWQGVSNIFTMLNYFTHLTSFKHFESSTCLHVHIQSHDTCGQPKSGDWIWTCEHVKDLKCLKFVRYFCFYSASTKTSFGFFSWSLAKKGEMEIAQAPRQL